MSIRTVGQQLAMVLLLSTLVNQVYAETSLLIGGESVRWEEFNGGARLLEEQGMRSRFGVAWAGDTRAAWSLNGEVATYLGQLSYRGEDWLGSPVGTNTTYIGVEGELGISFNHIELFGLHPSTSLGFELWSRDINGPGGYTENYTLYDVTLLLEHHNEQVGSYGYRFGINESLQINEQTRVLGIDIDLHPEPRPMLTFGLSYRFTDQLNLHFDYFGHRFGASPPSDNTVSFDTDGDGTPEQVRVIQPKSNLDRLAVTLQLELG